MAIYKNSTGRRMPLEAAMGVSSLYIGLVTHNFMEDVKNGDTRLLKEIETAKSYNLQCILLLFDNLTEEDKKLADKIFHEHRVIKKYENVPSNQEKFREWCKMLEIKKFLESLEK